MGPVGLGRAEGVPPTTTDRQPSTANRQPGQLGPGTVKNGNSQKWSPTPRTLLGHFEPVLTHFQPFSAGLAHFSLVPLETVMESNMGPKPVKNDFFQKWPHTLWEGQTDLFGPFGARFDQFYGYTGYRILDTGIAGKGPPPYS